MAIGAVRREAIRDPLPAHAPRVQLEARSSEEESGQDGGSAEARGERPMAIRAARNRVNRRSAAGARMRGREENGAGTRSGPKRCARNLAGPLSPRPAALDA
jgi:hypothetical protein